MRPTHEQHLLDEIHSNYTCDGSVCPGISKVTPIVGKAPSNIMVHTPSNSKNPHALPSCKVFIRVGDGRLLPRKRGLLRSHSKRLYWDTRKPRNENRDRKEVKTEEGEQWAIDYLLFPVTDFDWVYKASVE